MLLSRGRAMLVVAAVEDPREGVLPFRDLFSTRVALPAYTDQVDLIFGNAAPRPRAHCDRVPYSKPGAK